MKDFLPQFSWYLIAPGSNTPLYHQAITGKVDKLLLPE
ncbi:hypothetical protein RG47T_4623 [Mucilaginibacter polytrichastri]|uniref:Uncharacterized protein n=1 Tax=Mucilaginibacter polytrichastri TaxID=1302689 RepID=A0A1Q6A567_9SPHI|nr:hypothetical protein RG47T_4623 [Mucilaginibacter polytrichastri]